MEHGLIQLYLGDGKGKTTAALGQCLRAVGAGLRAAVFQFLKGGDTAELAALEQLGIPVFRAGTVKKFVRQMNEAELEACRKAHGQLFAQAQETVRREGFDLIVLDEVVDAAQLGLVPLQELCALMRAKPAGVELVLTGHRHEPQLEQLADYFSWIHCEKHPYRRGVDARKGIEY